MKILLCGGATMLFMALLLAWLATFARIFPMAVVATKVVKNYDLLIKSHIDYLMMSMFCFAFYAIRIPISDAGCWLVFVGGFSNPALFLVGALAPALVRTPAMRVAIAGSFATTTAGFGWVGVTYIAALL